MSYDSQEIRSEIKNTTSSREAVIFGGVKILKEVIFRLEEAQKPTQGLYYEEPVHTLAPGQTEVNAGKFQPEPSSVEGASQNANLTAASIADMRATMERSMN